jgi:hypothetical protein
MRAGSADRAADVGLSSDEPAAAALVLGNSDPTISNETWDLSMTEVLSQTRAAAQTKRNLVDTDFDPAQVTFPRRMMC